ncbi:MAG: hypothetical protein QW802_03980 [Candidatus Altiarchaeota archaeon]
MKKVIIVFSAILAILIYLVFAQLIPEDACKFYGSLHIDGQSAPLGTNIVAYINGNPVRTEGGMIAVGYYRVYVYEGNNGDTVTFKINNAYDASPTGTWQRRGDIWLPLTVTTGGGSPGACVLGGPCSNCVGWVTKGSHQVRDSGVGYYDQACCSGVVMQTQVI